SADHEKDNKTKDNNHNTEAPPAADKTQSNETTSNLHMQDFVSMDSQKKSKAVRRLTLFFKKRPAIEELEGKGIVEKDPTVEHIMPTMSNESGDSANTDGSAKKEEDNKPVSPTAQ